MATSEDVLRNTMLQAAIDVFNAVAASVSTLVFEHGTSTALATCLFSSPTAFLSAAAGVSTAAAIGADTAAAGGTIEHVSFYTQAGTKQLECTIATSTVEDFTIGSLAINSGDTVGCTSIVLTMPAS